MEYGALLFIARSDGDSVRDLYPRPERMARPLFHEWRGHNWELLLTGKCRQYWHCQDCNTYGFTRYQKTNLIEAGWARA